MSDAKRAAAAFLVASAALVSGAHGAPSLSFITPSDGQTVSGTLGRTSCEVIASEFKIKTVSFYLDSTRVTFDESSRWQCTFDTRRFANGLHTLKAVATDRFGATATAQLTIDIQNAVANSAPTVSFTTPSNGQTVAGALSCEAAASDDKGVTQVQFSLGATLLNTDLSAPWQCGVDTTLFPDGDHVLKAVATDTDGATSTAQITINIHNAPPPEAASATAIATFESLGLYWTPPSDPGAAGCTVRYRKAADEAAWNDGLPLWYDARNNECRGSLVHLTPDTAYTIELGLSGQPPATSLTARTWSENFPIAQTVQVQSGSGTLNITEGGTPQGYVLYTGPATLDAADAAQFNITINAPYVIVRGLTLRGAKQDAIRVSPAVTNVVIEDNDMSGWGRATGNIVGGVVQGIDRDAAIRANCVNTPGSLQRVIIQRNRIHDPRYGSNSWDDGHPLGPVGIEISHCGGNHVIRYNEITGSDGHYYKDGMGGQANFSELGFPAADTDIYGNIVSHAWDDGIEAEGGNRNVRVWGNYIDQTTVGIASTPVSVGPMYIFRNVYNRSRHYARVSLDADDRLAFSKTGSRTDFGNGRRYIFHNTLLQATQPDLQYPLGAGEGISGLSDAPLTNTVSRNNILHIWKDWRASIYTAGGSGNDLDYDLHNGNILADPGAEPNGIVGIPIYQQGHGWSNWAGGSYQLDPLSPGYDRGVRIPNFNDAFTGAAPDIGAHEDGTAAMRFGP